MLNNQSTTCLKKHCNPVLTEQYFCNIPTESANKLNFKPAMNTEYKHVARSNSTSRMKVNKTFEMFGGTLSESYFDVSDTEEAKEFIDDYCLSLNKGLILVVNDEHKLDDVINLSSGVMDCVQLIIRYNCSNEAINASLNNKVRQISTKSIKQAVLKAYNRVEDKQAILFAHVNSNFDLFEHI